MRINLCFLRELFYHKDALVPRQPALYFPKLYDRAFEGCVLSHRETCSLLVPAPS